MLLATFVFSPAIAQARDVDDFEIRSFTANYYLSRNADNESQIKVVEEIQAVFPEYDQNHGILRALPTKYNKQPLYLKVMSVTDKRGDPIPYSDSTQNDNLVLKIGDADAYVRGLNTYVITYEMKNVITFYDGYDELYWNVNGLQWRQPFGAVTARIHIPNGIAEDITKPPRCFTGYARSTQSNCEIVQSKEGDSTIINVRAANLLPGQNLTYLIGFADNTFVPYTPTLWEVLRPWLFWSPILIVPLLTLLWVYRRWRKTGRDPKGRGVIVAQYVPPKGFSAISGEGVLHETVRPQALSAGMIELAVAGYVRIHEQPSEKKRGTPEYSLELLKAPTGLHQEQHKLIHAFFGTGAKVGDTVQLKDLKNKLYKDVSAIQKDTMHHLHTQGYFTNNPAKAIGKFVTIGVIMLPFGFLLAFTGLFTPLGIGILVSAVIVFIAARTMPARTPKGVETREYLLGLKEYIGLAEQDRIKMLQTPEAVRYYGKPGAKTNHIKLFEALLPYAMLFGQEKQWAEQFKDLYTQPPDWYAGNMSAFHAGHLASSMHSFSTAAGTTFSPPASSGSSGYSGGGGFSGGGGGGGGGGGW